MIIRIYEWINWLMSLEIMNYNFPFGHSFKGRSKQKQ